MLKHGGGSVRESGPLSFHLGELVMSVRGRELGGISQGRDHGAACNIKVVPITFELNNGPEKQGGCGRECKVMMSVRTEERVETISFLVGIARSQM
jgi:hypothetical protein